MQQNTVYLNLSTAQHVSDGISTHHQLITLYLQYLALMRPVLLPVVNVDGRELHNLLYQIAALVVYSFLLMFLFGINKFYVQWTVHRII